VAHLQHYCGEATLAVTPGWFGRLTQINVPSGFRALYNRLLLLTVGQMMGAQVNGIFWGILAALACLVGVVWLALWYFIPAPPSTVTIAAAIKGGPFDQIAQNYRERLARHHVTLEIRFVESGWEDLQLIEDKTSGVDAAFLFGGTSNGMESPDLLSLGRINYAPLWVFYRGSETLDRLTQLKGKRVNVPPAYLSIVTKILNAHGVNSDNTTLSSFVFPVALKSMKDGTLDATFLPPQGPETMVVRSLALDPNIRLMNVSQVETLTQLFPSFTRLVLRQGVIDLVKNIPPADVNLIATTSVVVVRNDLHPQMIDLLAQTLQEEHGRAGLFQRAGEFPTESDPEFPMAEEARDFYKNGPSFLQRYLPFSMISYAKRIAALWVTIIAIFPIFNYAPRLYAWILQKYMEKLYRRLRTIEESLQNELTVTEAEALQADLENISRAAQVLPIRHSSLFFELIMHIDLTRGRLASRLGALRG